MSLVKEQAEDLQLIDPHSAQYYLQSHGWRYDDQFREIESYWRSLGTNRHITLPLRPTAGDFILRMAEFVDAISSAEERPNWDVIRDLQTASMDIISFRVDTGSSSDGTLPLRDGVKLFENARNALISAARSSVGTRALFQGGPPGSVDRYLERVRVGQTERGSYIVNLLSPVAAVPSQFEGTQEQLIQDQDQTGEAHFSRSVTKMLRKALESTKVAAGESRSDPHYRAFVNAVHSGVSANLCESLVKIYESGRREGIQVDLRWAYTLPQQQEQQLSFSFAHDEVEVLRGAATVLRATDPFENYVLMGEVVGLRRDDLLGTGRATVRATVEGKERHVTVDLGQDDYSNAVASHYSGRKIRVRGRLQHINTQWILEEPRDFGIVSDDPSI